MGEQALVILDQESAESLWDWLEHEPAAYEDTSRLTVRRLRDKWEARLFGNRLGGACSY